MAEGQKPAPWWWPSQAAAERMIVVFTLCTIIESVVTVLLLGLFDARVDNKEIFNLLSPPFNMIIGYFVGRQEKRTGSDGRA